MALAGSAAVAPERRAPPASLNLNLSSNNPFRNRATSPSMLSPMLSPNSTMNRYRMSSNNPFADGSETSSPPATNAADIPADIFSDLSLLDKPKGPAPPPPYAPPSRSGTMPVQSPRLAPPTDLRERPRGPPNGPSSPRKPTSSRPRRASESSIMEKERRPRDGRERTDRPERTESEERRRRERRREREERHRKEKEKGGKSDKPPRKPKGLDLIDQLDVTGVYGQGLFHHDGPFDACNPHRNARRVRNAPMQAFPADSANMAMGGSGPLRNKIDLDRFHGRGEEGFSEYAHTRRTDTTVVDPTARIEQVHGEETYGLGTSTFLEGAPASRTAMQRRDSEDPTDGGLGGGLSRKKSLAQRIRGMSAPRRYVPGELRSPEARYDDGESPGKATSAGGPARARSTKDAEVNPFDNDYEAAFEKKGTQIRIAEQEKPSSSSRPRMPPSPGENGLTRTRTADADMRTSPNDEDRPSSGGGGGFMKRMKSLKGPRRPKVEA